MGIVNSAILAITTIVAITIAELIFLSNLIDSIDHMRETRFSGGRRRTSDGGYFYSPVWSFFFNHVTFLKFKIELGQ